MAALEALRHCLDNPMQNKDLPDALTALSQMKTVTPVELASFTEIFGELHFKENPPPEAPYQTAEKGATSAAICNQVSNFLLGEDSTGTGENLSMSSSPVLNSGCCASSKPSGSSLKNSKNLQTCTEGLGFESYGDMEKSVQNSCRWSENQPNNAKSRRLKGFYNMASHRRAKLEGFPPPISSIGRNGKPWVSFRSYREGGRFVLREIRIPNQEFLHACRRDGRLKLHFIQPDDEIEAQDEVTDDDIEMNTSQADDVDDDGKEADEKTSTVAESFH